MIIDDDKNVMCNDDTTHEDDMVTNGAMHDDTVIQDGIDDNDAMIIPVAGPVHVCEIKEDDSDDDNDGC